MNIRLTFNYTGEFGSATVAWYRDDVLVEDGTFGSVVVTGATTTTLEIENLDEDWWGNYHAEVTDEAGCEASSDPVGVGCLLEITTEPELQLVTVGDEVVLTVAYTAGSSVGPFTVQWALDGNPLADGPVGDGAVISGATTTTLTITNVQEAQAGDYEVTITDASFPDCELSTGTSLCVALEEPGCCYPECPDLVTFWNGIGYAPNAELAFGIQSGELKTVDMDSCLQVASYDYGSRSIGGPLVDTDDDTVYYGYQTSAGATVVSRWNPVTGVFTDTTVATGGPEVPVSFGPLWVEDRILFGTGTTFDDYMGFMFDPSDDSIEWMPRYVDPGSSIVNGLYILGATYNPVDGYVYCMTLGGDPANPTPPPALLFTGAWVFRFLPEDPFTVEVLLRSSDLFTALGGVGTLSLQGPVGIAYVPTSGYVVLGVNWDPVLGSEGTVMINIDPATGTIVTVGANVVQGLQMLYSEVVDRLLVRNQQSGGFFHFAVIRGSDTVALNDVQKFASPGLATTPDGITILPTFDNGVGSVDPDWTVYCLRPYTQTELDTLA
jgi:hypothetical protein